MNYVEPTGMAVIGLCYWGPNMARKFAAADCASLSALCDLNEDALVQQLALYTGARHAGG